MGHPLAPDLSKLTESELNDKYNDLMSRLNQAHRWGNPAMVGQLQLLLQDYQWTKFYFYPRVKTATLSK